MTLSRNTHRPKEAVSAAIPEGVCIMIDALDEMQEEQHAHDLAWLPTSYPPNIKVFPFYRPYARALCIAIFYL